jgi:hypothetical protein
MIPYIAALTPSDYAAWYAAVVATLVLAWDVVKYRRATSRLRIRATYNMQILSPGKGLEPEKNVSLSVTNVGEKKTTITNVAMYCYKTFWDWLLRRESDLLIVVRFVSDVPTPASLDVGDTWDGLFRQSEEVQAMLDSFRCYIGVQDMVKGKSVVVRIKRKKVDKPSVVKAGHKIKPRIELTALQIRNKYDEYIAQGIRLYNVLGGAHGAVAISEAKEWIESLNQFATQSLSTKEYDALNRYHESFAHSITVGLQNPNYTDEHVNITSAVGGRLQELKKLRAAVREVER